jgi:hypothetical protein
LAANEPAGAVEPLYAVHRQVNVPPLREGQLREVVSQPAALLSARCYHTKKR